MNNDIALNKISQVLAGEAVIMTDAELDWLVDNGKHPNNVVSIPNPERVGILDKYLVGLQSHPAMRAARQQTDTLTSACRSSGLAATTVWDEPPTALSARGWYWPRKSTCRGKTLCAGHYLDYQPGHMRFDNVQQTQPGNIHCVVIAKSSGQTASWCYVETVEAARAWIEAEAAKFGHRDT